MESKGGGLKKRKKDQPERKKKRAKRAKCKIRNESRKKGS